MSNTTPETPENGDNTPIRADSKVLERLVCPVTRDSLTYDKDKNELISKKAGLAFPVRYGIPIMLVDEARELTDEERV